MSSTWWYWPPLDEFKDDQPTGTLPWHLPVAVHTYLWNVLLAEWHARRGCPPEVVGMRLSRATKAWRAARALVAQGAAL